MMLYSSAWLRFFLWYSILLIQFFFFVVLLNNHILINYEFSKYKEKFKLTTIYYKKLNNCKIQILYGMYHFIHMFSSNFFINQPIYLKIKNTQDDFFRKYFF